jgi:DNA-3-methyladenine glycosylase II
MSGHRVTIRPKGPFSLEEANNFGFGQRHTTKWDGTMRLAFCLDGYNDHAGVAVQQDADGLVRGTVQGSTDLAAVERQVARVLSLDHDGEAYLELGASDPVIAKLQAAAPGLRPPLFYSPYEGAARSIISAQRPARQMGQVRDRMSEECGRSFTAAGESVLAFATPRRLIEVESFPGLSAEKVERLHGVARAALDGFLDVDRLQALEPDVAMAEMRTLKGIGPFYAGLIVIRSAGLADVPVSDSKAMEFAARLWDLPHTPTEAEFFAMSEKWNPFRTWIGVLVRRARAGISSPTMPAASSSAAKANRLSPTRWRAQAYSLHAAAAAAAAAARRPPPGAPARRPSPAPARRGGQTPSWKRPQPVSGTIVSGDCQSNVVSWTAGGVAPLRHQGWAAQPGCLL